MRSLGWLMAFKCLHVYKCESILDRDRYEQMTSVQREWVRVKEVGIVPQVWSDDTKPSEPEVRQSLKSSPQNRK